VVPNPNSVKIILTWQRRAIIIFASIILLFSVTLTIFVIREAEREKLIKEREIEDEQRRSAELIIDQIEIIISEAEGRIDRLVRISQNQFYEKELADVCRRIVEGEEIVSEIFLIKEKGEIIFPLFKQLFFITQGAEDRRERVSEIETNLLFKRAETSEFITRNYPLAIKSYLSLIETTSNKAIRALLMNNIGRCYAKSKKHLKAIETYQKILNESPGEVSSDGIPLGIIAQYQIGILYREIGKEIKAGEAFFELYKGLLESRWPLTKTQFYFYRSKVGDFLKISTADIKEMRDGKNLLEKWEELERIEKEKLRRMESMENLMLKVIPLIKTKKTISAPASGRFHHLSETIEKELYLVSYIPINDKTTFGFRIDSEVLAKKHLLPILEKLSLRKDWHVQISDEFGSPVAGEDITHLRDPIPQLTFSKEFEENFPSWKVNIFQSDFGLAQRQFILRRNIYILSVTVVMLAIFFGGFLAIRSAAKEFKLAKLKSDFVATVSHEFRTPLQSIRYLAELLQRGRVHKEDKKQVYYGTITNESKRLSNLIENILDFSKIEAGMKEYKFEETDIAELTKDVASHFQEQVDRKEFSITSEISNQMPKVLADREAISRVLFNLLDNALKYSNIIRGVFLRAWADGESVFLEVQDEGIGISKQDQKKIYKKFYRTDEARESNIKGSGIGLTLVAHIIKAHGGEVLLESDVGKGTKVTVRLPVKRKSDKKSR
jgi:signal transduction histidine kinase/tetratricopeptide (TPR) repeat protein